MQHTSFSIEQDGFYGIYYPCREKSECGFIAMLDDSAKDLMLLSEVKYLHYLGCNVLAIAPSEKENGYHSFPIERFGLAIEELKRRGNTKLGVTGGSTSGMLALLAAVYYPEDISMTIAFTPPDFVMEGFYKDGLDGRKERPGDYESSVTVEGEQLPFLPYAYRHPEYWDRVIRESKESGNLVSSRLLFENSEKAHPVTEEERIKVEKIRGRLILAGAEDDALWDTCKYIRRMKQVLDTTPHDSEVTYLLYEHGTHFIFPQRMLSNIVPLFSGLLLRLCFKAAREYPGECKAAHLDVEKKLTEAIMEWKRLPACAGSPARAACRKERHRL